MVTVEISVIKERIIQTTQKDPPKCIFAELLEEFASYPELQELMKVK